MGFGIIKVTGNKIELIQFGDVPFDKKSDHLIRLKHIQEYAFNIIDKFQPDELSIEAPFYGKNVQSMLKLGRAQGICMAAALSRNIPVFEYSPKRIKQAITGSGNASKEQVAGILANMFSIKNLPKNLDATDGLAAALCHHLSDGLQELKSNEIKGKSKSWSDFTKENQDRIKR